MAVVVKGTRELPIATLTRYPGNPRRGDVAAISQSVRRLGQYRTIVVRDTGLELVILAGNHTTDALSALSYETVRAEVIECTDDEARRINLADNRLAELGGYDDDELTALLQDLDGDFDGTGWERADLDKLLADFQPDDDEPPRLDELEPRPCLRCGYDNANDPEALRQR